MNDRSHRPSFIAWIVFASYQPHWAVMHAVRLALGGRRGLGRRRGPLQHHHIARSLALGASTLTKDLGFDGTQVGKINVNEFSTYVAVEAGIAEQALKRLACGKVKGRSVKVRLLEG